MNAHLILSFLSHSLLKIACRKDLSRKKQGGLNRRAIRTFAFVADEMGDVASYSYVPPSCPSLMVVAGKFTAPYVTTYSSGRVATTSWGVSSMPSRRRRAYSGISL